MTRARGAELGALVAEAAGSMGLVATQGPDGLTYSVGDTVVLVVAGATAEFRLRADVAAAAARTPDAAPSPRGAEWVAFTPGTFDRFTTDRINAWILFAAREAGRQVSSDG